MARLYQGAHHGQYFYDNSIAKPIDNKTVVNSYESLFDPSVWSSQNGEVTLYSGIPVFVCEPTENNNYNGWDKLLTEESGMYVLARNKEVRFSDGNMNMIENGYQYLYNPNAASDDLRDPSGTLGDDFEPGVSNKCGWLKLLSFPDLKFPQADETGDRQYVLDIHSDGTWEWTDLTDYLPRPTESNTVLTAVDVQNGEYRLVWQQLSGGGYGLTVPTDVGVWMLVTDGNGNYDWVQAEQSDAILKIKNFADGTTYNQEDGRYYPDDDDELTPKKILSNSGEVIAVDVDTAEDIEHSGAERPFKLMLNYDKIPPLTVNGGNSDPDPDTYILYNKFWTSTSAVSPLFTVPQSITEGSQIPGQKAEGSTIRYNGTLYRIGTIFDPLHPSETITYPTGTVTGDITINYLVTAIPVWMPSGQYALLREVNNTIPVFPTFQSTDAAQGQYNLTDSAPSGTDNSQAPAANKYLYLQAPLYDNPMFTEYGLACVLKLSNAVIAGASYWVTGTSSHWTPFETGQNANPKLEWTAISGRDGEYRIALDYNQTVGSTPLIRFTVQNSQ